MVESFDKGQMATVNGHARIAAWIAQLSVLALLIGVTADKIGFNPLFIAMGFFDLIARSRIPVAFIAERRRAKRAEVDAKMKTLKHWTLRQRLAHHVELTVDGQHTLCLYVPGGELLFRGPAETAKVSWRWIRTGVSHRGQDIAVGEPSARGSRAA